MSNETKLPRGRPTECTPETTAKVCEALALGVSWEAAAAHACVSPQTLINWRKRGADGEQPFFDFLEAATRARDGAEARMAAIVVKAADEGNVAAAQWWLERRRSSEWAKRDTAVVEVQDPNKAIAGMLGKLSERGDA